MNKKIIVNSPQKIQPLTRGSRCFSGWCQGCKKEVEMVDFREGARIVQTNLDNLIAVAAGGSLHLGIRPEALLICLNSLLECDFESLKKQIVTKSTPKILIKRKTNAFRQQN